MKSNRFNWLFGSLAVLSLLAAAAEVYAIQELIAAFVIFTLVFCIVGAALLILFELSDTALYGISHLEARLARVRVRNAGARIRRNADSARRSPWN